MVKKRIRHQHKIVLVPSAERGGFEPPVLFNAVRPFSKRVLSASQPPLQMLCAANNSSIMTFRQPLFLSSREKFFIFFHNSSTVQDIPCHRRDKRLD